MLPAQVVEHIMKFAVDPRQVELTVEVLAPPAHQLGTHPKRYCVFRANSNNDNQQTGKAGRVWLGGLRTAS